MTFLRQTVNMKSGIKINVDANFIMSPLRILQAGDFVVFKCIETQGGTFIYIYRERDTTIIRMQLRLSLSVHYTEMSKDLITIHSLQTLSVRQVKII